MLDSLTVDEGLSGTRIDKYRIVEEVGFGGMSVVYLALDEVLQREVAVKLLHSHLSKRHEARHRFHREARAVAKLQHPNILEIYDFSGEDSPKAYIVTEFIRGPTLREFFDQRSASFPEIGAMIGIRLAEALAHAHEAGVIHRDVKPENVMIRPDGVVKLMDFGIAQVRDTQKMTETGSLLGSPAHMAPEVISGEEPDFRADIFSLGTVLYFLTTGELPFEGRNAPSILRAITDGRYVDPEIREPRIGKKLGGLIRRSLATSPDDRQQSVAEVADELRACVQEVGINGVHGELNRYFDDPDAYEQEFGRRVVTKLEERGREALERREIARAVDCFNRVLAIDDSHEGVRRLLGRLDRRRRLAGYGLAAGVALALTAIVLLVTGAFNATPPGVTRADTDLAAMTEITEPLVTASNDQQRAQEAAEAAAPQAVGQVAHLESQARAVAGGDGAGAGTAGHAREIAAELVANVAELAPDAAEEEAEEEEPEAEEPEIEMAEAEGRAEVERDTEGVAAIVDPEVEEPVQPVLPPALVPVRFRAFPPAAVLSVDGTSYGSLLEIPDGIIQLRPGEHQVVYTHPAGMAEPEERTIHVPPQVPEGHDAVRGGSVRMTWRPARILINSDIEGEVIVNGSLIGPTGRTLPYEIATRDGRQEVELQVVPSRGQRGATHERTITLVADQTYQFDAQLSN